MAGNPKPNDIALGIDVGGTFTDILAIDLGRGRIIASAKVLSTPHDPSIAAVTGIDRLTQGAPWRAGAVFHGTTVGTNALIQRRGARTALVTTEGFRDVLALRRQARPRLYDLQPIVSPPLVPRERRLEVRERVTHDGAVIVPLEDGEITRLVAVLEALAADAEWLRRAGCVSFAWPSGYPADGRIAGVSAVYEILTSHNPAVPVPGSLKPPPGSSSVWSSYS